MKTKVLSFVAVAILCTSCATILGGPVTDYQKTKPLAGQPQREVRAGALVADIFLTGPIGVLIDFATAAIYKPAPTSKPGTTVSK